MKITITSPLYINNDIHLEYTEKTIKSVKSEHKIDVALVVNHCLPEYREAVNRLAPTVLENKINCIASAWNMGIQHAIQQKSDYCLVINNDILLHPQTIDRLVSFAQEHPEAIMWTANEFPNEREIFSAKIEDFSFDDHPHFSCFLISPMQMAALAKKEAHTKEPISGFFDPNIIPAYFEDGDYHQRILHAGYTALKTASAVFYHYGSRTIKCDDDLNRMNFATYERNRAYVYLKHGFDFHGKVIANDDPIRMTFSKPWEKDISEEVKQHISPQIVDRVLEFIKTNA